VSSSIADGRAALATSIQTTNATITIALTDGRSVAIPLTWYPRLLHASQAERENWTLIANGTGIHWPELDEDLSVDGFLAGRRSRESQASLERWLASRALR
jgi:hypothetical protein